ncbi:type II 3-dehydroquinate dehydratase [Virgibacillus sp. MSP4-1]|uniref:type II 3-dehydroquinate dehydratase n=1 Tax=Virgibacillus sp. MSP4-1 TaxID=2700081 RepID=UPI0003A805AF|nr:type II 3-dehydroquinate dehydratase [Virgibacillus sp. MSP4-1]QHS22731.1 type II 3-dehydroquinate dehydratase [Virgibacillus sp. MSP4-1]
MKQLLLLNGPNLNLLGTREPHIYGKSGLQEIESELAAFLKEEGWGLKSFQSNHEGALIDAIHEANQHYEGIIFNPAAYTHTSVALRDAISAVEVPVIEVHISNVHNREAFRRESLLAPVCWGQIAGLGTLGYKAAALAFLEEDKRKDDKSGETGQV